MKNIQFVLFVFLLVSCSSIRSLKVLESEYRGYLPVPPLPLRNVELFDGKQFCEKPWASLSDSTVRLLLPNQSSQMAMRVTTSKGELNYITGAVTGEVGTYEIIMDYMKYRVEDVVYRNEIVGNGCVGIGMRVKATVITRKANLNISGLTSLGVEAANNHLTGLLSIDIIGLDSKDITNYIPLTAKLDETSIQNALQAIATIKSKIWDPNIKLTPQLIAVCQNKDSSLLKIKDKITHGTFQFTSTGGILKKYLNPVDSIEQAKRTEIVKGWMAKNVLANSITFLMYTSEMEEKRQQLITYLKLE